MRTPVVYVSGDSAARAVGADALARAFEAKGATVIRTGSRGMFWLEPMAELETPRGRIAYGPIDPDQAANVLADVGGPARVGRIEDHPWFKGQTRIAFARCGLARDARYPDFGAAFDATRMGSHAVIEAITASGLRGRGGAGFPAGVKWKTVAEATGDEKYVVCNADEGDSGTFADRMLMEGDPLTLIEGIAIAALAVGARKAIIYSRSEYPRANDTLRRAIRDHAGDLPFDLDIEVRVGAGAYVCGEETALLESLEGKRGQVRAKPPLPAHQGLFGKPTVINNVLTFASVPWIIRQGAQAYAALGVGRSRGTQPIQLAGNVKRPGLYEAPFGLTLGEIVMEIGGGTASGRPVKAVQCGGPLGAYFPPSLFDTPYDYEAFLERDGMIGHGGVVVFDDSVDMAEQARFAFEFCAKESCGKCTPCRVGSVRGAETIQKVIDGVKPDANIALVEDLCRTLKLGSLCALGGLTPLPVLSALKYWPEDFRRAVPQAAG